ncbi:30S ribosomal protein S1 [Halothiobacillus neapolitanus]|jgi:small subunit ribosomal protein S1|uniref:30S ribosomal protein S1 n=1 Tax=Halothiobacillus neapolitanus (strain ATCC 23641 / DSM 15147 / CIP 104769 / NCIMB 8539 / c2) TaxID=555778 RepID=D0L0E2_HALNC|nr:30S ribosomal protein S1 [Halothiobacillus neapolitanus]ACX96165.1 ribosomal protein S1 [Halothiobacillus neapolitanus c2]OZB75159.1 MAG: 30S ribosomal protein S1 [Halothiobacillus sp. 14-55-98]OZB81592.1 MAG: 30S ribosomal protein S1 [Halothiobacillus sp. 13-55-253]TDN66475.1 SSU ribosomal protein S1P [Halothiobacillus neapolitanus]
MSAQFESFADLFEESQKNAVMQPGAIIEGTVVAINGDFVVIDTGLKSEGVIPAAEFLDENGELTVKVGDKVDVALESVEDGFGETKLSREKALRARAWTALEKSFKNEEIVTGRITGKVKGGFTVEMGEIRAFLPGSLVDVRPIRDTTYLEGKDVEFKIIKLDQKRNNVVVSRRAVVEQEYSAERDALLDQLQEGMVLRGVVKNLTDYGAFLDLGGIDGLLHITDMAWKRVKHPSEVVNIGDEVDVKVLKFDRDRNRVSLGMKQMGEDPWSDLARRFPISSRMFGKVTNLTDYGCFVEIDNGVEGLVHVSEMDWTNKNVNPGKVVSVGDEVEVMILDIDEERRRISLGMKQCQANPWDAFAASHQKGDKVSGQIKSITDFGVFIGLDGGIDGLIHLSDLSWNEAGEEAVRQFKKGEEIEAVVIAIDPERERISLGLKQLESDPIGDYAADNQKGKIVNGTVREVDARGAVIDLGEGVEGYLRASDISRDRIDDARTVLKEGDAVEAKVMGVDRKNRMVSLSIRAKDSQEESEAMEELSSRATVSNPTLGDLLKEQLNRSE